MNHNSATDTEKLVPPNISDLGQVDGDSGLHIFRGMLSPWDKLVSFKETYHYAARCNALMAASFYDVLRIVEPDYRTRTQLVGELWAEELRQHWDDPNLDLMGLFRKRWNISEGDIEGVHLAGQFADKGDERLPSNELPHRRGARGCMDHGRTQ